MWEGFVQPAKQEIGLLHEVRRPYGAPAFMAWLSPGFPSPCSFAYAQGMATGPPGAILLLPLRGGRCARLPRLPRPSSPATFASLVSLAPVLSCSIWFRHNYKQKRVQERIPAPASLLHC